MSGLPGAEDVTLISNAKKQSEGSTTGAMQIVGVDMAITKAAEPSAGGFVSRFALLRDALTFALERNSHDERDTSFHRRRHDRAFGAFGCLIVARAYSRTIVNERHDVVTVGHRTNSTSDQVSCM